jgi:hypothetical protein
VSRGSAAAHMDRDSCWPAAWLAGDFPSARLLTLEYLAPVSAWEVRSGVHGRFTTRGVACLDADMGHGSLLIVKPRG